MIASKYLTRQLDTTRRRLVIRSVVEALWRSKVEFDAIAVRGVSGLLIGPAVADHLRKHLLVVRKPRETYHTDRLVEGEMDIKSYVIVDDIIASGDTVRSILEGVRQVSTAKPVGIFLYDRSPEILDPGEDIDVFGSTEIPVYGCWDGEI